MARKPFRNSTESFGMVVYASQLKGNSEPNDHPIRTHTFASLIHIKLDRAIDTYSLSWLPRSGRINGLLQVGKNYTLYESIEWAKNNQQVVYAWHALEITRTLFESMSRKIRRLEANMHRYYVLGMGGANINCVHALSDLDCLQRLGIYYGSGIPASRLCLDRMKVYTTTPVNPSLYEDALGLPSSIVWLESKKRELKPITERLASPSDYLTNLSKDLSEVSD